MQQIPMLYLLSFILMRIAPHGDLLGTPGDAAPGQIVGTHLNRDLVAGQDTDEIHAELAGDMGQYGVPVSDVHLEHGVGQGFHDCTLKLDYVVFRQN